jgi:DNA adenine methylase
MTLTAPPFGRYYGSKYRLAGWIASHLPRHTCYCEPYGGSAAVLLSRDPPAPLEVYNDRDGLIVTTYRVLRERPADLAHALRFTPWSRAEADRAFSPVPDAHPDRDLEIARRMLVRAWQTRGGPTTRWRSGWRYQRSLRQRTHLPDRWTRLPERIRAVATRLQRVQLECDEALAVIRRYDAPTTCFYLDPPYPPDTRSPQWRSGGYRHELSVAQHRRLAEVLHGIQGQALISCYPNPLYADLYADWRQVCTPAHAEGGQATTECLWLSPAALRDARQPWLPQLAPAAALTREARSVP